MGRITGTAERKKEQFVNLSIRHNVYRYNISNEAEVSHIQSSRQ